VSGTFYREMPGKLGGIISDFGGGGVNVSAPLFARPPAIGTYPPGRGEGDPPCYYNTTKRSCQAILALSLV